MIHFDLPSIPIFYTINRVLVLHNQIMGCLSHHDDRIGHQIEQKIFVKSYHALVISRMEISQLLQNGLCMLRQQCYEGMGPKRLQQ